MIFSAIFNYFMAIDIGRAKVHQSSGKSTLIFTVVVNLFILSFFKYYGFLMDTVNGILGTDIKYTALALPIGISFYTFQALSYIFDVYRGNVKVQVNPLKFTLYLSLFPQLIAGPIVKYKDIAEQLDERHVTLEKFGDGTMRFLLGLGKVILANNLGAIYTQIMAVSDSQVSVLTYWIGIIAYTLQIYFDFSGYSDMAIGLGRMFGFEFMENFNYPYISKTITEFWRRWHMSLSTWFREYVYIPLGGNRVSVHRHIINLLVVWSLTGLWHGASWNFVVWGLYYGVLDLGKVPDWKIYRKSPDLGTASLCHDYRHDRLGFLQQYRSFSSLRIPEGLVLHGRRTFCQHLYALFAENEFDSACYRMPDVYAGADEAVQYFVQKKNAVIAIIMILLVLVLATAYLIFSSYNPFLYFRF